MNGAEGKSNPQASGSIAQGKTLAKKMCSRCHAIGTTGASTHKNAPPLRLLAKKYPLESLEEALAEGIVVGHDVPEMPKFELQPNDISDLIRYLRSISPK